MGVEDGRKGDWRRRVLEADWRGTLCGLVWDELGLVVALLIVFTAGAVT